ncbi:MAG: hypothetical protein ABJI65_05955, partial [Tateyamaria sp.]|uniref:hypothetical protein n=1 Tax=Tateyamaria sp. TaxID=1929288 RepID=UPI00329E3FA8
MENRWIVDSVQVRFVASKTDQKRAGCTTRTRVAKAGDFGGGPVGAFEVLLELLVVHPLLSEGSPSTVGCTPDGWKPFTRT